jgi:hypothetical protein
MHSDAAAYGFPSSVWTRNRLEVLEAVSPHASGTLGCNALIPRRGRASQFKIWKEGAYCKRLPPAARQTAGRDLPQLHACCGVVTNCCCDLPMLIARVDEVFE